MHKTHIFDQKNNAKKNFFTDLPTLFFSDRYRKQTISLFRPYQGNYLHTSIGYRITGELGYDGQLYNGFLHMTDNMLGPSPMYIKYSSLYTTDFAYDRPIFLVPLSLSYPSSPV